MLFFIFLTLELSNLTSSIKLSAEAVLHFICIVYMRNISYWTEAFSQERRKSIEFTFLLLYSWYMYITSTEIIVYGT